jgi:hypothetical protein
MQVQILIIETLEKVNWMNHGLIFFKISKMAIVILLSFYLKSCDPEGRKECLWTLEPEPRNIGLTDIGMIPVCARNRESMKQDCRLQTTLSYAKKNSKRLFRYTDLEIKSYGIPRTIESIEFCK